VCRLWKEKKNSGFPKKSNREGSVWSGTPDQRTLVPVAHTQRIRRKKEKRSIHYGRQQATQCRTSRCGHEGLGRLSACGSTRPTARKKDLKNPMYREPTETKKARKFDSGKTAPVISGVSESSIKGKTGCNLQSEKKRASRTRGGSRCTWRRRKALRERKKSLG